MAGAGSVPDFIELDRERGKNEQNIYMTYEDN